MRLLTVVLPVLTVALATACQSSGPAAKGTPPTAPPVAPSAGPATPITLDQRREAPLPEPRQEVASAADDELGVWVAGGFDGAGRSTPSVFRYRDGAWTREPDLPLGLNHPAAAVLDETVYVAGGNTDSGGGSRPTGRFFALPGPRELAPLKHARAGLALVAVGDRLYAIGGVGEEGHVGPAEEYDPRTNKWTDLPPLPRPRDHVAGFAYEGKACVAGGRSPNTAQVHCWDPAGRRWTALPDLPAATSGAGGGTLGERAMVAGGEDPDGGTMIDRLAVLEKGAWSVTTMAVPRHGIALAPYRGRLWACGGGTRAGLHTVADCTSIK
jgi:Kelch motif